MWKILMRRDDPVYIDSTEQSDNFIMDVFQANYFNTDHNNGLRNTITHN